MLQRYLVVAMLTGAAALAQEPMRISGGVMAAQVLTRVEPVYPAAAQAAGVSGAVVLHAIIGADGLVKSLEVVSGPEMLRTAALDAVRRWTYRPYMLRGEPRPVDTVVTVQFGGGSGPGGGGAAPVQWTGGAPGGVAGASAPARIDGSPVPRVVRISGGVMAGQIATKVSPRYPQEAKAKGISGVVVMRATISKEGTIENLSVVGGPDELRGSAMDAVSQWTYKPYLLNGEPTEVDTTITVNYSMTRPAPGAPAVGPSGDELGAGDGPALDEGPSLVPAMIAPVPGTARISGAVMAASIAKKVAPSYPADARAKGITGTVVMRAIIGKDGAISQLAVVSGPQELRGSAMKAVKQWRYRPYTLNGVPTEVDTTITVNYDMGW